MMQTIHADNVHSYFDNMAGYWKTGLPQLPSGKHGAMSDRSAEGMPAPQGVEHIELSPAAGQGKISRLKIREGLEFIHSDITLEEDWQQCIFEERIFEINYCLSGSMDCSINGIGYKPPVQGGNIYVLENSEVHLLKRAKQRYHYVEIRSEPEQLLSYFDGLHMGADIEQIKTWLAKEHASKMIAPLQQTMALKRAFRDMIEAPYSGLLKRVYIEAKVLEILVLVLENRMNLLSVEKNASPSIKQQDLERLHYARELVESRIENPLSLKELARATELNEFKLKTGFKQLFDMTVFEYIRDLRLEKGLQLIKAGHCNIGEAAAAVGYSNPSNFSIAFYKKYGCTPSDYIKIGYVHQPSPHL